MNAGNDGGDMDRSLEHDHEGAHTKAASYTDEPTAISLHVRMRVRFGSTPFRTMLSSPTGTIIEEEERGTVNVKLDSLAIYTDDDDSEEVRELFFECNSSVISI
jgi:hypothetical protein